MLCSARRVIFVWGCVWTLAVGSVFAIAAMPTAGEAAIARIVAISGDGLGI
ncbi:MAG: hypothetical protein WAM09_14320 [Anaerolineales bacterium]